MRFIYRASGGRFIAPRFMTCDGLLEDYFLEAGQRLSFTGPARLRVSAAGPDPARLLWARHPAAAGTARPPVPKAAAQPLAAAPAAEAVNAAWAGS